MGKTVVAALYDSKEHSLRGINPGLAILTCPSSVSSTRRESEQRALSRAASRFAHTPPDEKGIEYLVGEIAKIVGSLKTDGHGVSRLIDVAVHAPGSMRQFCVEARVA